MDQLEAFKSGSISISTQQFRTARNCAEKLSKYCRAYDPTFLRPLLHGGSKEVDEDFVLKCFSHGLLGVDPIMVEQVMFGIKNCINNSSSVLITGETGTGKEVIAECIHQLGKSAKGRPFVPVNCAEYPDTLLESELFGIVKGMATGVLPKEGILKSADGGTLFLDEIGELQEPTQVKLLRFLNDKMVRKIGSDSKGTKVNTRLLAATNKNVAEAVAQGEFRSDFLYRLNTMEINLPALRQRRGDLPLLMCHFINEYNDANGASINAISHLTLQEAMLYRWPGNVRELKSRIERACNLTQTAEPPSDRIVSLELDREIPIYRPITAKISEMNRYLVRGFVKLEKLPTFDLQKFMDRLDLYLQPEYRSRWVDAFKMSNSSDLPEVNPDTDSQIPDSPDAQPATHQHLSELEQMFSIPDIKEAVAAFKYEYVSRFYDLNDNSKKKTARALGLDPNTIRNILNRIPSYHLKSN